MASHFRSPQHLKQASEITMLALRVNNRELVQISSPEHWVKGHSSHSRPVFLTVSTARAILLLPWIRLLFIHKTWCSRYQPGSRELEAVCFQIAMLIVSRFSWAANPPDFIEQFTFPSWFFKLKNYEEALVFKAFQLCVLRPFELWCNLCILWCFALTCLTAVVLLNQSNHLNHSNKDCDWLILACFMRVQMHADVTSVHLENKVCFENNGECVGKLKDFLS